MLQGWNNRDTVRPTSFMMVSKFSPVFVGVKGDRRFLFQSAARLPQRPGSAPCCLYENEIKSRQYPFRIPLTRN